MVAISITFCYKYVMQPSIFDGIKTIAIVGLSDNPERPSYEVGAYLQLEGFQIIPINPNITEVLGEKSYPSLLAIPKEIQVDVVDVFRRSEFVMDVVKDAVERGDVKTVWLQEGIENPEAESFAREKGLHVISNFCLMKAHKKSKSSA